MAHTRDEPGDLAAAEGEASDLFGEAEPLFSLPVAHVAETLEKAKGRGRPKGAANKRTTAMRDILLKMGFRHPMQNLAAVANADPLQLAAQLSEVRRTKSGELVETSCTAAEAMALIVKANVELLPYFESKRPVEVHVEERSLGVLVVGEMPSQAVADGVFSLTSIVDDVEQDQ